MDFSPGGDLVISLAFISRGSDFTWNDSTKTATAWRRNRYKTQVTTCLKWVKYFNKDNNLILSLSKDR